MEPPGFTSYDTSREQMDSVPPIKLGKAVKTKKVKSRSAQMKPTEKDVKSAVLGKGRRKMTRKLRIRK
jgi:hypothetical protein